MAYCTNCGTQLEDGFRFCPECGHPINSVGEVMKSVSSKSVLSEPEFSPIEIWQKVIAVLLWPAGLLIAIVLFAKKKKAEAHDALYYTSIGFILTVILCAVFGGFGSFFKNTVG